MGGKRTSARVTAYVPPETATELEEWAKTENRTVSNLAATILENAVQSRQQYTEKEQQEKGAA